MDKNYDATPHEYAEAVAPTGRFSVDQVPYQQRPKHYYATPQEYAERVLLPLLGDDADDYDVDGITEDMGSAGLLMYTPGKGFSDLSLDADYAHDDQFTQHLNDIFANNDKESRTMKITVLRMETVQYSAEVELSELARITGLDEAVIRKMAESRHEPELDLSLITDDALDALTELTENHSSNVDGPSFFFLAGQGPA